MNIEAGKYYRMRCGGAVKIEKIEKDLASNLWAYSKDTSWSQKTGFWCDQTTELDIIAEITEAEYNRIISGNTLPVWAQTEIAALQNDIVKIATERAELKAQLAQLTGDSEQVRDNQEHNLEFDENIFQELVEQAEAKRVKQEREQRRFEAAKAAMQGVLSNPNKSGNTDWYGDFSLRCADALLKALEETK